MSNYAARGGVLSKVDEVARNPKPENPKFETTNPKPQTPKLRPENIISGVATMAQVLILLLLLFYHPQVQS